MLNSEVRERLSEIHFSDETPERVADVVTPWIEMEASRAVSAVLDEGPDTASDASPPPVADLPPGKKRPSGPA